MKIRVVRGFGVYEAGQVFEDWPAGMCDILIGRGLIEKVEPVVERAEEPPAATETADARFQRTQHADFQAKRKR